jgi:ssDNA-specific exonuclease RecJ
MDEILLKKLEQKIQETISNKDEIKELIKSLSSIDDSKSFALGIAVGRIYNSFYYQSKRILNREPTKDEFKEFLEFIQKRKSDLETLW